MGASPPALVADLVEHFERDRKVLLSSIPPIRHSDFGIRTFPSNPFFESLDSPDPTGILRP